MIANKPQRVPTYNLGMLITRQCLIEKIILQSDFSSESGTTRNEMIDFRVNQRAPPVLLKRSRLWIWDRAARRGIPDASY